MSEREYEMLSLEEVNTILADPQCVGIKEDDERFPIGQILIFSAFVGEDDERLQIATGIRMEKLFSVTATLHKNGVFGKGIDHYKDYFENDNSGICLNCDILCGEGMLERQSNERGEATWKNTDKGIEYIQQKLLKEK